MSFSKTLLHITLAAFLAITLMAPLACKKKTPPAPEPAPSPEPQKTSIPLPQIKGIRLNGKPVEKISAQASDPQVLDAQDLAQAFGIKNAQYLEGVLQLVQSQIQSGSPLKFISLYLGSAPKKYAAQCVAKVDDDTCLIETYAFNCSEALQKKNWSDESYDQLCQSLGRLKAFKPIYMVALFDGDNTMWYQDVSNAGVKQGVDSKRIKWGEEAAELLSVYPTPEQRKTYQSTKTPYDYYKDLYKAVGPLWNYNYAALAFRGLSLKAAYENFQELTQKPFAPIPFPEMADLLSYLNREGIVAAVVSASPLFGVMPMVESMKTGIPLDRIEGLDVFVKNTQAVGSQPVRLGRLINQGKIDPNTGQTEKFKDYQDVLQTYGAWLIVDVDHVINARGGKGVQSRSIARRHVAEHNRKALSPDEKISIDDMRLVLIGGDNFAPATDIQSPDGDRIQGAIEGGNDQGLSEGLAFLESSSTVPGGTDLLFIQRFVLDKDNKTLPKKGKLENFQAYVDQERLIRPTEVGEVIIQGAITDVKAVGGQGGFLKESPKEAPETQPSASPGPETQPSATPPAVSPQPLASPAGMAPAPLKTEPAKAPPAIPPGPPQLDQLP